MLGSSKNILRLIFLFIYPEKSSYPVFALYVPNVQFTHQEDKPAVPVEMITLISVSIFINYITLQVSKK